MVSDFLSDSIEVNYPVTIGDKFDFKGLPKYASKTKVQILNQNLN